MIKNCVICEKKFETNYSHKLSCSNECSYLRDKNLAKERFLLKQKIYDLNCKICNSEFKSKNSKKQICSDSCQKIYHKNYAKQKKINNRIKLNCVICQKEFERDLGTICCSKRCREINRENFYEKQREFCKVNNIKYSQYCIFGKKTFLTKNPEILEIIQLINKLKNK